MTDELIRIFDPATRLSVTAVDCTSAAVALAGGHLCGPVAAYYLAQALAAVSLLGEETSQKEEVVSFRLDCAGPLSGFLVECTAAGTLRGYTKKKIFDDFDGMGKPKDKELLGASGTFEVIRSIPGAILSSGVVAIANPSISSGLDAFFAQSLQRRVKSAVHAATDDGGRVLAAKGILVECPPDGDANAFAAVNIPKNITVSLRNLLGKLGIPHAEIRPSTPLSFACRCSAERASAMIAAIPPEERASMPSSVDVTCHMCGRTWTVQTMKN